MIVHARIEDLVPTKKAQNVQGLIDVFEKEDYDETKPIDVEYTQQGFKIIDGHRRYYAVVALASTVCDPCPSGRIPIRILF